MTQSKKKLSAEATTKEKKPLAVPVYTRDNLSKRTISELKLIRERSEAAGLNDIALICLEVIEEKKLLEPMSKPRKSQRAIGDGSGEVKIKRPRARSTRSSAILWHFDDIGAPLHNPVWSWGAISLQKGDVILRVWEDEIKFEDDKRLVRLTLHSKFMGSKNNGYLERMKHIDIIKNKKNGYVIICEAMDITKHPRKIRAYDRNKIYPIREIIEINGDDWGVLGSGILISEFLGVKDQ